MEGELVNEDKDADAASHVVRQYERRETVEAFQFTEAMAMAVLLDKQEVVPWGLSVGGSYHPEQRKVWSASVWVPAEPYSGMPGRHARYGDWVTRINGKISVVDDELFVARYRQVGCADTAAQHSAVTLPSEAP